MKRIIIALLLISLLIPCVAAAGYDGMTVLHRAWFIDGTEYVIADDGAGKLWYFVDGELRPGAGLVFVGGYYYYVRTNGYLAYDSSYYTTTTNDLLPAAQYQFDAYGRLIDPPSMPDGWEDVWFDSDPTIPPDTEPTEPEETVDPDAIPTEPGISDPPEPITPSVYSLLFNMIVRPADWSLQLFSASGMIGIFLAAFLVYRLVRLLLAPVLGHAGSDTAKRSKSKEE